MNTKRIVLIQTSNGPLTLCPPTLRGNVVELDAVTQLDQPTRGYTHSVGHRSGERGEVGSSLITASGAKVILRSRIEAIYDEAVSGNHVALAGILARAWHADLADRSIRDAMIKELSAPDATAWSWPPKERVVVDKAIVVLK